MNRVSLVVLLVLSPVAAIAGPGGELDASFGDYGRLTIAQIGGSQDGLYGYGVAQQSDGRLVVGGTTLHFNSKAFALIRLHPNGEQDPTFGTGGSATLKFPGYLIRVVVQPDDKIIAAGGERDFVLARFNNDGTRDATFGTDGLVTLDLGGFDEGISGIDLLPSGQIIVAGTTDVNGDYDVAFARFTSDGILDSTFGTGPIAGTTLVGSDGDDEVAVALIRRLDGQLVACGASDTGMLAVRLNDDGSVDSGFGSGGISTVSAGAMSWAGNCIARPDGSIVLAGGIGGSEFDIVLTRLSTSGELDTSFGNNGHSIIDLGGGESVSAMIAMDDGRLAVAGGTSPSESWGVRDMFLALIDPDSGALDTAFGHLGRTIVDFGNENVLPYGDASGLIRQADGKLLAVGTYYYYDPINDFDRPLIALARVDPSGAGSAGIAGFADRTWIEVDEDSVDLTLAVRRSGGSTGFLSVDYLTEPGSAGSTADYTATSGTLTWDAGDMASKSVTIAIVNDTVTEPFEQFTVVLANSSGGLATSRVTVQIKDDDRPPRTVPATNSGGGGTAALMDLLLLLGMACLGRKNAGSPLQRARSFGAGSVR